MCYDIGKHLYATQHCSLLGPQQLHVIQLCANFSALDTGATPTCRTNLAFQFLTERCLLFPIASIA